MKTLIYFTNLVSICMNTWINTLFYIRLFLVCVFSSLIWISSLILCTTSLYALAGPKIGQIKSCILYLKLAAIPAFAIHRVPLDNKSISVRQ